MLMTFEELLGDMGQAFRSLTLHSDGRWTAKTGRNLENKRGFMVTAHSPLEALQKLHTKLIEKELL